MTQAQLAARCGMPQSHIAKIEKGRAEMKLSTLRRILEGLFCRLVIAPQPERGLDEVLREQARRAAVSRVKRVSGTMAMEEQKPDEEMLEDLVRAETERLLQKRSSAIWDAE